MDTFLTLYDRWQGLIPFFGGIYATLLAYGYLPRKPKDPERLALWQKKFGPMMRVLGPLMILVGAVTLAVAKGPEGVVADAIEKLDSAPKMVDAVTRFDSATEGPALCITVRETIVSVRGAQFPQQAWQNFLPQLRRNVANSEIGRLPRKGITVDYRYYGNDGVMIGELRLAPGDPK